MAWGAKEVQKGVQKNQKATQGGLWFVLCDSLHPMPDLAVFELHGEGRGDTFELACQQALNFISKA